jgi:hypothetical protein
VEGRGEGTRLGRAGQAGADRRADMGREGHEGRRPGVVLEHDERPVLAADDVRPVDADPQPVLRERREVGLKVDAGVEELVRDHALRHRAPRPERVGDEGLERAHPLLETGRERRPLRGGEDAGHRIDVQRTTGVADLVAPQALRETGGERRRADRLRRRPERREVRLRVRLVGGVAHAADPRQRRPERDKTPRPG